MPERLEGQVGSANAIRNTYCDETKYNMNIGSAKSSLSF